MPDICDHANEEMEFLNQIKFSRNPPLFSRQQHIAVTAEPLYPDVAVRQ